MNLPTLPVALPAALALLAALSGCDDFQPRQLSRSQATSGMPPLTGTLPNGVIGDSATK